MRSIEGVELSINGEWMRVEPGSTVAAAILNAGRSVFRRSVSGQARGPVCGMGICFECRVTIDGIANRRSCQIACREGMKVETE